MMQTPLPLEDEKDGLYSLGFTGMRAVLTEGLLCTKIG